MFIHLDDSLLVEEADPIYCNILRAVRNLAIAAFESKHILYGDYAIIEAMRTHFQEDPDVREVFNKIYQSYSRMACPKELSYYLKVVKEPGNVKKGVDENGKSYGLVSYAVFENTRSTQECNLICEDFNDCYFYKLVLDYYKNHNKVNISCSFNDVQGAGDRTRDNIKQCVCRNRQISLCIVDTDKKYPEQGIVSNSTCGKCMYVVRDNPCYLFYTLDVHEVENLIPFNVVDQLQWSAESQPHKDAFDHLRNNAKSEYVLPYFDIKNGVVNDDLLRNDTKYRKFVENLYYLHPGLATHGNYDAYLAGLEDKAVVFPHLLKGLLKRFLEYMGEHPHFDMELLDYQRQEWNKIGKCMLDMGCSRNSEALV